MFQIVIILALIFYYIIPMGVIPGALLFLVLSFLLIFFKSAKFKIIDLGLILVLILLNLNFVVYNIFQIAYLALIMQLFYLKNYNLYIGNKNLKIILYLSSLSIILQLSYYRREILINYSEVVQRLQLSINDPNFSAALLLAFFFLSVKLNFRIGIFLIILSALLLESRNFILALAIFYFVRYTKIYLNEVYRYILNPFFLFIIGNLLTFALSAYWVVYTDVEVQYASGLGRYNLLDSSNYGRFMANLHWIDYIISNFKFVLLGVQDFEVVAKNEYLLPHNSFLYTVLSSGILFSSVYFLIILHFMKRVFTYYNYEYITAFFVFSYFLHGMYSGFFLFLFILMFMINFKKKSTYAV
jgi:hypothetical protein